LLSKDGNRIGHQINILDHVNLSSVWSCSLVSEKWVNKGCIWPARLGSRAPKVWWLDQATPINTD